MLNYADRIQETTTTTGTGTINLSGAVSGYRTFASALSNGAEVAYGIAGGTQWEIGVGVFVTGTPNQLQRTTVHASSNSGSLVNLDSVEKKVFVTLPARLIPFRPVNGDPATARIGETWFNDSNSTWCGAVVGTTVWTASTNITAAKTNQGCTGAVASGLLCGGETNSTGAQLLSGTTWTNTGSMGTGVQQHVAFGTAAASVAVNGRNGGVAVILTQLFNGATWSNGNNCVQYLYDLGACGTSSAGLKTGGDAGGTASAKTETFNGTTWSAGTDLTAARKKHDVTGGQTTVLVTAGENTSSALTDCYKWNGSAWSTGPTMPQTTRFHSSFGNSAGAVAYGGETGSAPMTGTWTYNGTAWSTGSDLNTARYCHASVGSNSQTTGMAVGGQSSIGGAALNTTEIYATSAYTKKVFTVS